ncbi:MAG TPA: pilus assembly protein TadG-related protein [Candidatus Limnocylindria bacterium]
MRTTAFSRADEGQVLVIVALAMVVLMGALALALDWGYGYVQRRGTQNAVDSATLAAARHVASTFKVVGAVPAFDATIEEVCDDVAARTATLSGTTEISFFSDPTAPGTWTTVGTSGCAAGSGVPVPNDTSFVRIRSMSSFRSLTQQTITIAASARARLSGSAGCGNADCAALRPIELPSTTPPPSGPRQGLSGYTTEPNVAIWPIALHLNMSDFGGPPCGLYCSALSGPGRRTIWPLDPYGPAGFRGLLTFTHFSPRESDAGSRSVHQFNTESDYTGTTDDGIRNAHDHNDAAVYPKAQMPNADSRACGAAPSWDTLGRPSLASADTIGCDLPNWFHYGYRGSIGLSTDWSGSFNGLPGAGVDRPEQLPVSRSSCDRSIVLPRPSCTGAPNQIGDWIETVPGDLTPVIADQMLAFVRRYGRVVPNSSTPVSASPGAPLFGKAVTVYLPLWDCAENFDPSQAAPDRWQLIIQGRKGDPDEPDCSTLKKIRSTTVDRVHIAAVVPFAFYEGLITSSPVSVQAYWGDAFGDAGICTTDPLAPGCVLNEFMNSAFLVPDE